VQLTEPMAASLKDEGNTFFKNGEYLAAIDAYSKSLDLEPEQHLCFSNRSAAYLKLGCSSDQADASVADFLEKALADANTCVEINPAWAKGYSRQAAALQELKKWDEAVAACQKGLQMSKDAALEKMLIEVLSRRFQSQLKGFWNGTVDENLGGYDQEMEFLDDTQVRVAVLGRSIVGKYWVDGAENPQHLNIQVPMQEAPPGMPPPPPVPYIAKIDSAGLHICCPFMTMDRPTKFEGPGYCLMLHGPSSSDNDAPGMMDLSHDERLLACARELINALPEGKIEEVSQHDTEESTREKLMAQVRFESSMFTVQKKFGEEILKDVLGATRPGSNPSSLAGSKELRDLEQKLNVCGLLDAGDDVGPAAPPRPPPTAPTKEQAPLNPAASADVPTQKKAQQKDRGLEPKLQEPQFLEPTKDSSSIKMVAALALGTVIVAAALVVLRRQRR